jgi:hypothetical protein
MVGLGVFLSPCIASADSDFSNTFEKSDVRIADSVPNFWTVLQFPDVQNAEAFTENGRLNLVAANQPFARLSMVSPAIKKFGFFAKPVTVTLHNVKLEAKGMPENEARFKVSLASSPVAAEQAPTVISMRIRSGLLLLGYRIEGFNMKDPVETLSGQKANPVAAIPLKGVPTKVSLTLGPSARDGFIRYEVSALVDGLPVNGAGSIPLTMKQWGGSDTSSLIVDVRRDNATSSYGSEAKLSIEEITATR